MKQLFSTTFLVLGIVLILGGAVLAQKSVAGEWDAQFSTPGGAQGLKLILKVDGEKLTGTAKRSRGDVPITGTIKGDDISFAYTVEYNGNAMTISFSGKVKGDTMSGTVSFNDQASDNWSAKRAAAKQ